MPTTRPLRTGDRVSAAGVVIREGARLGLYVGTLPFGHEIAHLIDQPKAVGLSAGSEVVPGVGRFAKVSGTWTGGSILVESVLAEQPAPGLGPMSTVPSRARADSTMPSGLLEELRKLSAGGELISFSLNGGCGYAVATDIPTVKAGLSRFVPELEVAPNRISVDQLRELHAVVAAIPARLLSAVGESLDSAQQLRVTAKVTWVEQELHDRLLALPSEAYLVEGLVGPDS